MLMMIDGKIQVVSDWPEISSKCQLDMDRPTLGLRNKQAVWAMHEALENRELKKNMKKTGFFGWLFD